MDNQYLKLFRGRVLDWFHIVMKFQAAQHSVFGSKMIDSMDQDSVGGRNHPREVAGMARAARQWGGSGTGPMVAGEGGIMPTWNAGSRSGTTSPADKANR
ncbi:hypothetical protein HHL24_41850 [Paraburkholderia sp. RP-4-7]|uniref:Uncharacterized protein n=1 Tax=Paraburkholderia polaris TaxID=2728848 RepID=A0A848ITF8_9BURK|nr:hypothetical protein [Paraburkholderia polaris]NMM04373.1 hypothetical protein [Paraburkholderia polaris]